MYLFQNNDKISSSRVLKPALLLQMLNTDLQVFLQPPDKRGQGWADFSSSLLWGSGQVRFGNRWHRCPETIFAWPFLALSSTSVVLSGGLLCPLPSLSSVAAIQYLSWQGERQLGYILVLCAKKASLFSPPQGFGGMLPYNQLTRNC